MVEGYGRCGTSLHCQANYVHTNRIRLAIVLGISFAWTIPCLLTCLPGLGVLECWLAFAGVPGIAVIASSAAAPRGVPAAATSSAVSAMVVASGSTVSVAMTLIRRQVADNNSLLESALRSAIGCMPVALVSKASASTAPICPINTRPVFTWRATRWSKPCATKVSKK